MDKINVLVVPSDNIGGVGFYRSTQPHIQLEKQFPDEFSVTIDMNPDWSNHSFFDKFQLIHIHKGLTAFPKFFIDAIAYCKSKKIVTVLDIDDHWKLSPHHPQYQSIRINHTDKIITDNLRYFDYVTTTTPLFANEIKKYNQNVFVLPNAIDPTDDRFKVTKPKSDKIRVGLIMGSSHEYDMMLLNNIAAKIKPETLEKIQFVLCGFDLRGNVRMYDRKTGKTTERKLEPKETVWYRYEKMLTNDYKIVSPEYKKFLNMFIPNTQYPNVENEHYKRCWTKDMNHYYQHYKECDILLAPLEINDFNLVKSQLKVIECCFSNTAIIASDFGPYQLDIKNMFEFGGKINMEGNGILINERKNHKDWAKAVDKLVAEPSLITTLQNNLHNDLKDKYSLQEVTKQRAIYYKRMINEINR